MICTTLVATAMLVGAVCDPTGASFVAETDTDNQSVDKSSRSISSINLAQVHSTNTQLYGRRKRQTIDDLCLTPDCIHAASELLRSMDTSVNPCDDFYKYVCGNYIKETNIPDDKSSMTAFNPIVDKMNERLRSLLEEPSPVNEPRPFHMAKELYNSCMNTSRIEQIGVTQIKKLLKKFGGWPVLEERRWLPGSFTWKDTIYKLKKEGFDIGYLFDLGVADDFKNSTRRVIAIDQPPLSLDRRYLVKGMNEPLVAALYDYMVDIAELLGANRSVATRELKQALLFQIKLAKISLSSEERRDPNTLYNPMTMNELQTKFPSIPWFEFMSRMFSPTVKVKWNEVVVVAAPTYMRKMEALLSTTPKRVVSNYLLWRVVSSTVAFLPEALRRRQLLYSTSLTGRTQRSPRWQECVGLVAGGILPGFPAADFSLAVGSMYVKRFFDGDAREHAEEIVNNIRSEMYKILQTIRWMDDATREHALEKARSMTSHIAYPQELLDVNKLEDYYQDLDLTSGDYLEYILNLNKFGLQYNFRQLRKPVNRTDWTTHGRATLVNAVYNPIENSIQIPAGILSGVFFSNARPNYMNYAGIGYIIGHEITHGFDDQGRQFDKVGNLVDWWDPETKRAYLKKASCIINQYGNYTAEEVGLNLNGVNTQGENIADNGGLKEAYWAYNQWVAQHGVEQRLPGLQHLSPQQLFWVSAANTWCSKYRPETLKLQIITGVHSPGEFRVRGPMSNRPEFSRDFKCRLGSKMNPVKKCQVW